MSNQRAKYSFIAIMVGLILVGGAFFGSAPIAFADHDTKHKIKQLKELIKKLKAEKAEADDKDEKKILKDAIKELKKLIKKLKEDKKCPEKFKYGEICDRERPEIEIEEPENKDKLPAGMITIEIEAEDEETGIKMVEVRINDGPFLPATQVDDDEWEFKVTLGPGKYKATAKATDLVDNISRDSVKFRVVP